MLIFFVSDYDHNPIAIMNRHPNTEGLQIMARYKGVKPIKITLKPEMIEYAKSKGNASAFINELLEKAQKQEEMNLSLNYDQLNELGEARETINELMRKIKELNNENYRLWEKSRIK